MSKVKVSKHGVKSKGEIKMVYGYARVSTKGQATDGNSLEAQEKEILAKYENAIVYKEAYTGTTTDRPVFKEIVSKLKQNDMLVVAKLDRLARNTVEGIEIVKEIFKKKASVHVLNVGLLEDTAMGQFFLTTLLAVAELERNQIVERTQTGKAIAKQNNPNFKEGRPKTDDKLIKLVVELSQNHTIKEIVEITNLSRSTVMRIRKEYLAEELNK